MRTSAQRFRSARNLLAIGTALGTTLAGAGIAQAQNIASNGSTDYSLTRTDPISGGPRTVDITTSGGDITLDLASVDVANSTGSLGAGIAANNTGVGLVGVTSGTVTATGSGQTFGIDARTTSGAITITSGAATSTSTNSAGIYALSTNGGVVTIDADQTIGGRRAIYTGFYGGLTTINSNFATANGLSQPNAIIGQGDTVVINSGTATLTGDGVNGAAIFAQSRVGDVTITSGTASTEGSGQWGVDLQYSAAAGSIDSGTITTRGNYAHGVYISTTTLGSVKSGSISTSGDNAAGIYVEPSDAANITTIASGTITTTGNNAGGIAIYAAPGTPALQGAVIITSDTITTSGDGGYGVGIATNGAIDIISRSITGSGANAAGIRIQGGTGAVDIDSGVIDTTGAGISVQGGGSINVVAQSTTTSGANAAGISLMPLDFGNVTLEAGTVATSGDNSVGITSAAFASATDVKVGSVTTTGAGSTAILVTPLSGTASVVADSVRVSGANSNGIDVHAQNYTFADAVSINAGTVDVSGGGFGAFAYTITGTADITVDTMTVANGRGIYANGASLATVQTRNVAVTGDNVAAIYAVATATGGTVSVTSTGQLSAAGNDSLALGAFSNAGTTTVTSSGSITTAGDRTYAISVGGQTATISSANILTTGAASDGIHAVVDTGPLTITSTRLKTDGAGAYGIYANATTGAISITSGAVATKGDGSVGIFAQTTEGDIAITASSAIASGAGANAIEADAGGSATVTIGGPVKATNGTGVFIRAADQTSVTIGSGANISGGVAGLTVAGGNNTITNAGTIGSSGGVGISADGATTLVNSGVIAGANGIAVQLSASNDSVTLSSGSTITGAIAGGGGIDVAILDGASSTATTMQQVASFTDFDSLTVRGGYWTAAGGGGGAFNSVVIGSSASLDVANGPTGIATVVVPTYLNDGTLIVRSDATSGGSTFGTTVVTGSGGVVFAGSGTATLDGDNSIASTGPITVAGGTVLLTGTQGGAVITNAGGTFAIGNGTTAGLFTGDLVDNGKLVIDHSDTYNFDGALTGSGSLVKQGAGTLVFGAGYAFTGTTTLNGGSIKLTTPVAASTELAIEGAGTFDLSGTRQTVAELSGASRNASVNIAGGALTVNQSTNTSFAGNLTGDGSFTKTGAGSLNFTGNSTYTGPTTVSGGRLAVNGSIVSAVTVNTGATLGGTGSVGSVAITSGGTYAPGNSIGTQTVNGNVTFAAGSTYAVETNADGRSDKIIATGTATISGGKVSVLAEQGVYNRLTNYNILTAGGGVSGTFATVTSNFAYLSPLLSYGANSVTLTLARNDIAFGAATTSPNQFATANAVEQLGLGNGVYNAVLFQSTTDAPTSFNRLSGEIYASLPSVLIDGGRRIRDAVLERGDLDQDGVGIWGQAIQTYAHSRSQPGIAKVDTNRTGGFGGVDYGSNGLRFGLNGGYYHDNVAVPGRISNAGIKTTLAGANISWSGDRFTAKAGGTYAWHSIDVTRTIGLTGLAGTVRGKSKARSYQVFGELGYKLVDTNVVIEPFLRNDYVHVRADALTETGGLGALDVDRDTRHVDFASVGVRLTGTAPIGGTGTFRPRATVAYQRGFDGIEDTSRTLAFDGAATSFVVNGARLGRDSLKIDGGFDVLVGSRFSIGAGGFGSTSREWSDYGGTVSVGFRF